jgi:hypothetical protein
MGVALVLRGLGVTSCRSVTCTSPGPCPWSRYCRRSTVSSARGFLPACLVGDVSSGTVRVIALPGPLLELKLPFPLPRSPGP